MSALSNRMMGKLLPAGCAVGTARAFADDRKEVYGFTKLVTNLRKKRAKPRNRKRLVSHDFAFWCRSAGAGHAVPFTTIGLPGEVAASALSTFIIQGVNLFRNIGFHVGLLLPVESAIPVAKGEAIGFAIGPGIPLQRNGGIERQ